MQVRQLKSLSFGASLKGDGIKLIRTSVNSGFDNIGVKKALNIIHQACPKKEDRVYLYYRNMKRLFEDESSEFTGVLSGVKVAKDGIVLEKNIDPRGINPKYLLYKFAITVRNLVTGKVQPDETVKIIKHRLPDLV